MKGILGKKVGMTQIFDDRGEVIPVTVIEAGPCFVAQIKTVEKDGYSAVQLGFEETKPKHLSRPEMQHLQKSELHHCVICASFAMLTTMVRWRRVKSSQLMSLKLVSWLT